MLDEVLDKSQFVLEENRDWSEDVSHSAEIASCLRELVADEGHELIFLR